MTHEQPEGAQKAAQGVDAVETTAIRVAPAAAAVLTEAQIVDLLEDAIGVTASHTRERMERIRDLALSALRGGSYAEGFEKGKKAAKAACFKEKVSFDGENESDLAYNSACNDCADAIDNLPTPGRE